MSDAAVLRADPTPGIVRLTLNRPQQRNALSVELMSALESAFDGLADEPGLRATCGPVGGQPLAKRGVLAVLGSAKR